MDDNITEPESAEAENPQEEEQEETPVVEEEETGMTPGLQELYEENNLDTKGEPLEKEEPDVEDETVEEEEETPDEEGKEKYSKRVQARINKATKSLREEERKSKALEDRIAELEAVKPQEVVVEPEPPVTETKVAELGVTLSELKRERKQARRDFDDDKIDELDDKIDALKDQILDEKYKQPAPENITKMVQEQQLKVSYENAAKDFSSKNQWFRQWNDDGTPNENYDHMKSSRVVTINNEIGSAFKGTPYEMFEEITSRVNEEFPPIQPKRKMSAVGGVQQNTGSNNTETVALDEVQRGIAHAAFPEMTNRNAEKEYAKINKQYGKRSA